MQLTLADVLEIPSVRRGLPSVKAGATNLGRRVRWVHISEQLDIARRMYGGEVLLTTGVSWQDDLDEVVHFVHHLADAGTAGLIVECVYHFHDIPRHVIEAARERHLPLIALEREIPFIDVTQDVHARLLSEQMSALESTEAAHRSFTTMCLEGATVDEIVAEIARLTDYPVVLESLNHQLIATGGEPGALDVVLRDWETASRRFGHEADRPNPAALVTDVGARGEQWGRLVMIVDDRASDTSRAILERGATTVALNRLVDRDRQTLERHAHGGLLSAIADGRTASSQWIAMRSRALGVPLDGRTIVGMVVRRHPEPADASAVALQGARSSDADHVAEATRTAGATALVGSLEHEVGLLLSFDPSADLSDVLTEVARAIHKAFLSTAPGAATIGVGSAVDGVNGARRSLLEAQHAAESVRANDADRLFYRLTDVGVRGLTHILRSDTRLQTYVERTLSSLLLIDRTEGTDLEATLRAFLAAAGNKSLAADAYGLSRPAFYARLARIQSSAGIDLDDAETRTGVHLALIALDAIRSGP